jgi:hypothetical protein
MIEYIFNYSKKTLCIKTKVMVGSQEMLNPFMSNYGVIFRFTLLDLISGGETLFIMHGRLVFPLSKLRNKIMPQEIYSTENEEHDKKRTHSAPAYWRQNLLQQNLSRHDKDKRIARKSSQDEILWRG